MAEELKRARKPRKTTTSAADTIATPEAEPVKKKAGRPQIEIDQEQFEKLCELQCTVSEIASYFRVSVDTIERWCKRTYNKKFVEVLAEKGEIGKVSMRRNLIHLSERNAAVAIFLAKNYLGMKDVQTVEQTNLDESQKKMDAWFAKARKAQQEERDEIKKRA